MIRSNLCDHSDAYILSGIITTDGEGDDTPKRLNGRNKGVISKNYAPFY